MHYFNFDSEREIKWYLYAQNPGSSHQLFGASQGVGTAILTLLGEFNPQTQNL